MPGAGREVHDEGLVKTDLPGMGHDHALVHDHALQGQVLHAAQQGSEVFQARDVALGKSVVQGQDDGPLGPRVEEAGRLAQVSDHDALLVRYRSDHRQRLPLMVKNPRGRPR